MDSRRLGNDDAMGDLQAVIVTRHTCYWSHCPFVAQHHKAMLFEHNERCSGGKGIIERNQYLMRPWSTSLTQRMAYSLV
jgi:hypothetical protein